MFTQAWQPTVVCCDAYVGEGTEREQWYLLHSLLAFSHFPCYPQAKWALLVLIPIWVGLCTFWDPVGLSKELSCEAGSSFTCSLNPQSVSISGLRLYFPMLEPWGCVVCFAPPLFLSVYLHANVGSPSPPATALPTPFQQQLPFHESSPPCCPSLPLL